MLNTKVALYFSGSRVLIVGPRSALSEFEFTLLPPELEFIAAEFALVLAFGFAG
jgi:hypothetical protein